MPKIWEVKSPPNQELIEELKSKLKVDRVVAELLLQRNITSYEEAEAFFRPQLKDLHDPFLMKNMEGAVERLNKAIQNQEKVLLFGDYDVDGTTAVALMFTFLKDKCPIDFYIPDRYKEGYGLSKQGIDYAIANDCSMIISLDCGIRSVELVDYAKKEGLDFIVCDHHEPGDTVPNCYVLDPKQKDCLYPYKELSGCGVAFKLLQGLTLQNNWEYDEIYSLLDFLALSIGADIVDVTGENRILAYHGLKLLNENPRSAFKELVRLASKSFPLSLTDVVFTIAPRINAVGRLRSGKYAVELMIADDPELIQTLSKEIDDDNKVRRELDRSITLEALQIIEDDLNSNDKKSTVVFQEDWHKGVVGIVASRLIEKYYKPTIVLTLSNGVVTGSARSVDGVNVLDAIVECEHLLEQYGGHSHAAGLSLKPENLETFKHAFEEAVVKQIEKTDLIEKQRVDIAIDLDEIFTSNENRTKIPRLKRILMQFEPHGPGNMQPVFQSNNLFSTEIRILKDDHLKLTITQPNSDVAMEAIGFNKAEHEDKVAAGIPFDMAYTMEVNRWRNRESLQLNIRDIRETI